MSTLSALWITIGVNVFSLGEGALSCESEGESPKFSCIGDISQKGAERERTRAKGLVKLISLSLGIESLCMGGVSRGFTTFPLDTNLETANKLLRESFRLIGALTTLNIPILIGKVTAGGVASLLSSCVGRDCSLCKRGTEGGEVKQRAGSLECNRARAFSSLANTRILVSTNSNKTVKDTKQLQSRQIVAREVQLIDKRQ